MSEKPNKHHIELDLSEDEIEVAIKKNDEKIMIYLVEKLVPDLSYTKRKWSVTEEDVWDNFNDTWIVVITKIKNGKYKKNNFVGYFKTISNNIWLKFKEDQKHYSFIRTLFDVFPAETEDEQYERLIMDDRYKFVEQCRNELSDIYQKIIDMYYYKKMSHKQIAESMGIKEENARQKKFDSIKKLKACVRKLIGKRDGQRGNRIL